MAIRIDCAIETAPVPLDLAVGRIHLPKCPWHMGSRWWLVVHGTVSNRRSLSSSWARAMPEESNPAESRTIQVHISDRTTGVHRRRRPGLAMEARDLNACRRPSLAVAAT